MPGLVREVYVRQDDEVERGGRLLVLEAMKMNNEVRAPRAGTVQTVRVEAGQRVDKGDVMVVLG
jgi:biotin carboxyl carrier protein